MIDLDRGVTKRAHPAGVVVCMYKDDPGVYLDTSGKPLSEKIALEAGFPVDQYAKERQRRERVQAALAEINEEFGNVPVDHVVLSVSNYKVVHAGNGGFVLKDEDDTVLTPNAMDKNSAIKLARKMAANEKADVKKAKPDKDEDDGASA